jgi:uncharacterized protein (TIGR03084 family)
MEQICDDLDAEHAALDAVVDRLSEQQWDTATPAADWTVRDQVSHLWFFDQRALLALTDSDAFVEDAHALMSADGGGTDASVQPGRQVTGPQMMDAWREARAALLEVARRTDPSTRVPWYGPAMGARSFITARLMETWAHGQDVVDALGVEREPSPRLRHVAHIGVRARPFSYANRKLPMPDREIHVALAAPDGDTWTWGDPSAADTVRGPALDFCLAVTQRRHVSDTALEVTGDAAREWMSIAQAFAGPPGPGRSAGQFTGR